VTQFIIMFVMNLATPKAVGSEASLLSKSSCLAPALGVIEFSEIQPYFIVLLRSYLNLQQTYQWYVMSPNVVKSSTGSAVLSSDGSDPTINDPNNTKMANYRMVKGSKMANVVNSPEGRGMAIDPNGSRMVDNPKSSGIGPTISTPAEWQDSKVLTDSNLLSETIFQQKSSNVKININDVCNLINA